jgi:sialidase-1
MGGSMVKPLLLCVLAAAVLQATRIETADVFRSGEEGYHTYRIPALIVTRKGTLLAFCEGRRLAGGDSGDIDLLLKRSFDQGKTWSAAQVLVDFGLDTIGNPAPVEDRKTGVILLLLTRNPGDVTEKQIVTSAVAETRTVWITRSADDGTTWSPPEEITSSVKRPSWTWYATGPGNGIQLRTGRLVIPCDHMDAGSGAKHSHVIYSDDHGKTWRIGGVAGEGTNESAVVELRDGSLLLNMRSYLGRNRRAVAHSLDGGLAWSPLADDPALIEPVCQASLIAARGRLLFSNPADTKRDRITVRLSRDDGKTWPVAKLIYEGPSGYSSLAALRDGTIGLLYERGVTSPYERIAFLRFSLGWLVERPAPVR